jgi:hypothetical protein
MLFANCKVQEPPSWDQDGSDRYAWTGASIILHADADAISACHVTYSTLWPIRNPIRLLESGETGPQSRCQPLGPFSSSLKQGNKIYMDPPH